MTFSFSIVRFKCKKCSILKIEPRCNVHCGYCELKDENIQKNFVKYNGLIDACACQGCLGGGLGEGRAGPPSYKKCFEGAQGGPTIQVIVTFIANYYSAFHI